MNIVAEEGRGVLVETRHTAASVTCGWLGAIMQELLENAKKSKRGTDRPTDRRTDEVTYRKKVEECLRSFFVS